MTDAELLARAHAERPADWLAALSTSVRAVTGELGPRVGAVAGIAVSAWGPGLVLVDRRKELDLGSDGVSGRRRVAAVPARVALLFRSVRHMYNPPLIE